MTSKNQQSISEKNTTETAFFATNYLDLIFDDRSSTVDRDDKSPDSISAHPPNKAQITVSFAFPITTLLICILI